MAETAVFPVMFQVLSAPALKAADQFFNRLNDGARRFGQEFNDSQNQLQRASFRIGRLAGLTTLVGVGVQRAGRAMTQFGISTLTSLDGAVQSAGDFQLAMAKIGAIVGGDAKQMAELRNLALDTALAETSTFGEMEAAAGLEALAQAGLNAKESAAALAPALRLAGASMGEIDPEKSALIAVQGLNTLGVSLDPKNPNSIGGFMDKITVATQKSNLGFKDMQGLFANLKASGIEMRDTSVGSFLALSAASRNAGTSAKNTGIAIQGFAAGLRAIQQESDGLTQADARLQALASVGLKITDLQNADGGWKDLVDTISLLSDASARAGKTEEQFGAIVGKVFRQNSGQLAQLGLHMRDFVDETGKLHKGIDSIKALRDAIQSAGVDGIDQAGMAAKRFAETWEGVKKQFANIWEVFKTILGGTVLPLLVGLLERTNTLLRWVTRMAKESAIFRVALAGLILTMSGLLFSLGALMVLAGFATIAISALGGAIAIYTELVALANIGTFTLSAAFANLEIVLAPLLAWGFPLFLAVLLAMIPLIVFAGAAIVAWQYNINGFADTVTKRFEGISNAAKVLFAFLNGEKVPFKMGQMLFEQTPLLGKFVIAVLNLKYRVGQLWEGFKEGLMPALEELSPVVSDVIDNLGFAAKVLLSFFKIQDKGGKSKSWREFGIVVGNIIGLMITLTGWGLKAQSMFLGFNAILLRVVLEVNEMMVDFIKAIVNGFLVIPRMIAAVFNDDTLLGVLGDQLQKLRDILPGSEPRDRSSPLYGLGDAGAALLRNVAMGMLAFAPTFGALASGALSAASAPSGGSPSPLSAIFAPSTSAAAPAPIAASATSGGITVNIGQMVFQAAELTPEQAQKFARVIADNIAAELATQISSGIV